MTEGNPASCFSVALALGPDSPRESWDIESWLASSDGSEHNGEVFNRARNLWRPWNFHFHHRLARPSAHFEGWYFKVVDAEGGHPYAFIPGVFLGEDRHAFVQVLDGSAGKTWYHRFELDDFSADTATFDVRVGDCHFHPRGLELHLDGETAQGRQRVDGALAFGDLSAWPITRLSPGVMGPYAFVPFMECNHGIISMDHTIDGALDIDGSSRVFDRGHGYMEKDWGRSFPQAYVWTQSNRFERPGVSVSASVARIPWLSGAFRGFLVGFLLDGTLHRFTTYNRSAIEALRVTDTHMELSIHNPHHRLELRAEKRGGAVLMAPYQKQMLERVAETMTSEVAVRLFERGSDRVLFDGTGANACLEVQGELSAIVDD